MLLNLPLSLQPFSKWKSKSPLMERLQTKFSNNMPLLSGIHVLPAIQHTHPSNPATTLPSSSAEVNCRHRRDLGIQWGHWRYSSKRIIVVGKSCKPLQI